MNTMVPTIPDEGFEQGQDIQPQGMMDVATTRSAQEVQAMVVMAKKFPRNTVAAEKRILDACKRKGLAEVSQYSFNRGGLVEGPSIRLAEVLAQNWGNLDYGVVELERQNGVSTMMAYCWDIETNVRKTQVFSVKHWRDTKKGGYQLKDERDVYEVTANNGARRVRNCILAVIPGDIVDAAVAQCDKTMAGGDAAKPMKDRITEMVKLFEQFEVNQENIEKFLGHPLTVERMTEPEMLRMKKIFITLKDKQAKPEDYFVEKKVSTPAEEPELKKRIQAQIAVGEQPSKADLISAPELPINHQPYVKHESGLFDTAEPPKLMGE